MKPQKKRSLRRQLIILNILMVILVLSCITGYISLYSREKLEKSIYHDMQTKNRSYVNTILSIFEEKKLTLLALRDDLEKYDTLGQMWIHLASHTGEKIFNEKQNREEHIKAFRKKVAAFQKVGQLSDDKMSPQLRRIFDEIKTNEYAFGKGMKFFYIGMPIFDKDKTLESYYQYQDSSLWVPDPHIEEPYNPLVRPWYIAGQEAGRDDVVFTEPYAERRTKESVLGIATAIDVNGVRGSLASAISIKPIIDDVLRGFQEDAHIAIFSKGVDIETAFVKSPPKYIYSSRDASLGNLFKTYNSEELVKSGTTRNLKELYEQTKNRKSGILEWKIDNEERLVSYATVPSIGWKIFVSVSKKEKMKAVAEMQYRIALLGLAGVLALALCIYIIVNISISPIYSIGKELQYIANTGDLNKRITTSIPTREIEKIAKDINQMLDNTLFPIKELGEAANRIAQGQMQTEIEITAKGDIGNLVDSFSAMTRRLAELEAQSRDASPLTGLPGGVSIEKMAQSRIESKTPFAFCLFDIDNFKPFNDHYGYSQGNLVIKNTANIITTLSGKYGAPDDFIGHIGGDDFVLITSPDCYEKICREIIREFDASISDFYSEKDREQGYIISKDRQGSITEFPFMSISISIVDSQISVAENYIKLGEICASLKSHVKKMDGSNMCVDRRTPEKPKFS